MFFLFSSDPIGAGEYDVSNETDKLKWANDKNKIGSKYETIKFVLLKDFRIYLFRFFWICVFNFVSTNLFLFLALSNLMVHAWKLE